MKQNQFTEELPGRMIMSALGRIGLTDNEYEEAYVRIDSIGYILLKSGIREKTAGKQVKILGNIAGTYPTESQLEVIISLEKRIINALEQDKSHLSRFAKKETTKDPFRYLNHKYEMKTSRYRGPPPLDDFNTLVDEVLLNENDVTPRNQTRAYKNH